MADEQKNNESSNVDESLIADVERQLQASMNGGTRPKPDAEQGATRPDASVAAHAPEPAAPAVPAPDDTNTNPDTTPTTPDAQSSDDTVRSISLDEKPSTPQQVEESTGRTDHHAPAPVKKEVSAAREARIEDAVAKAREQARTAASPDPRAHTPATAQPAVPQHRTETPRTQAKKETPPPAETSPQQKKPAAPGPHSSTRRDGTINTMSKKAPEAGSGRRMPEAPDRTKKSLQHLRTYKSDIAAALKNNRVSRADIVQAEAQRSRTHTTGHSADAQPASRSWKRLALIGGLIVLIIAGGVALGAGLWYGLGFNERITPDEALVQPPNIIPVNASSELSVGDEPGRRLTQNITRVGNKLSISLGDIVQIYPTRTIAPTSPGARERIEIIPASNFLNALDAAAPSQLTRVLLPEFFFGYHAADGYQPLFIFKITSFEGAFAGMLEWEQEMQGALAPIFGEDIGRFTNVGTSTERIPRTFDDRIISNQDIRVLTDDNGDTVVLYAFPDRSTLIITSNNLTFLEALRRLSVRRVTQ